VIGADSAQRVQPVDRQGEERSLRQACRVLVGLKHLDIPARLDKGDRRHRTRHPSADHQRRS
jgi:hypothetical protein